MKSPLWDGDWPISQLFGVNPNSYIQFGLAGHNGLDIAMPIGTQLYSPPLPSTVAEVADDPTGYGHYIKLTLQFAAGPMNFIYGHTSSSGATRPGDELAPSTPIALSGNSGNSTGPHLHLGWRLLDAPFYRGWPFNGYVDPRQLLDRFQGGLWPPNPQPQ